MSSRYRVESSHAGRGWRFLQLTGFLALASGLAVTMLTWDSSGKDPTPLAAAAVALAGLVVHVLARGMARLLHG